jgi:hypothetical protein
VMKLRRSGCEEQPATDTGVRRHSCEGNAQPAKRQNRALLEAALHRAASRDHRARARRLCCAIPARARAATSACRI